MSNFTDPKASVQTVLLVFLMQFFETSFVVFLGTLQFVAETAIDESAVHLEQRGVFIEIGRI
jgi:hypothetical protein